MVGTGRTATCKAGDIVDQIWGRGYRPCEPADRFSLQSGVFRLGPGQCRKIRVGVLPNSKEVLIDGLSFGDVPLHGVGAPQAETGKRIQRTHRIDAPMVENLLVLGGCLVALLGFDESLSAKICGPIA